MTTDKVYVFVNGTQQVAFGHIQTGGFCLQHISRGESEWKIRLKKIDGEFPS